MKNFDKFWLTSHASIVRKDHFNQKLSFWPQVLFKKILQPYSEFSWPEFLRSSWQCRVDVSVSDGIRH